jgi:hypothetical protein
MRIATQSALFATTALLVCFMVSPAVSIAGDTPAAHGQFESLTPGSWPALQQNRHASPGYTLLAQLDKESAASSAPDAETTTGMSEAEQRKFIADAINNPLTFLWLGFLQNDMTWYDGDLLDELGEDAKLQNTTMIEPVMSFQLTKKWKTIFRPVIPVHSFTTVDNVHIATGAGVPEVAGVDFKRETGLGDIVLWNAFSRQYKPPFVWGFGPTIMLPTATDDQLGTGKWSAGPMALAFSLTDKWIIGGIYQHWWSFAGKDNLKVETTLGNVKVDRPEVNLTDFQYVLRYRLTPETSIGCSPNIRYNWESDQLSLPIGLGIDTVVKIGPMPMKIGIEPQYYVEQNDDFGPKWNLRIYLMPVIPSPAWARKALF